MSKYTLALVVPNMAKGGAQRIMLYLTQFLSEEKFRIHLVVISNTDKPYSITSKDKIKVHYLNKSRVAKSFLALRQTIRTIKPDCVITSGVQINLFCALFKSFIYAKAKWIVRESSIPSARSHKYPKVIYNWIYKRSYNKLDHIISQSQAMKADLTQEYGVRDQLISVINNPIPDSEWTVNLDEREIDVLYVGGLRKHKRVHLLIKALEYINEPLQVEIIGKGGELANLQTQVGNNKNQQHTVVFRGEQSDVQASMRRATVLVLPSAYEGFPNVLVEANVVGTPVIAFDVPGGTSEIINNGVNGLLIQPAENNSEQLARAIEQVAKIHWDRLKMASNAKNNYSMDRIIGKYEKTIIQVCEN